MPRYEQIEKLQRRTCTLKLKIEAIKLKCDQNASYTILRLPKLIQLWNKQHEVGELTTEKAKRHITPEQQELWEQHTSVQQEFVCPTKRNKQSFYTFYKNLTKLLLSN